MDCDVMADRISAYVDGELQPEDAADVRTHLESCAHCQRIHQHFALAGELVRQTLATITAPEHLETRVLGMIADERSRKQSHRVGMVYVICTGFAGLTLFAALLSPLGPLLRMALRLLWASVQESTRLSYAMGHAGWLVVIVLLLGVAAGSVTLLIRLLAAVWQEVVA